ncbi:hypothetical protein ACYX7E_12980 [Luteimonas sp. RIT-PG2_3]
MTRKPTATGPESGHDSPAPDAALLLRLVRDDRIDDAIEAGLMRDPPASPDTAIDADGARLLADTRLRLQRAWEARERHRARAARLARRAAERDARRVRPPEATADAPPDSTTTAAPVTTNAAHVTTAPTSSLPTGAAAILARAKAKAAARGTPP